MDKVTIEITKEGWKLHVKVGENEFTDIGVMESKGSATHEGDDIEDMHWMDGDLSNAVDSFFTFDVAQALYNINE